LKHVYFYNKFKHGFAGLTVLDSLINKQINKWHYTGTQLYFNVIITMSENDMSYGNNRFAWHFTVLCGLNYFK
jgi:hypothetical protein